MNETAGEVLDTLALEEKASLTSGANFWTTKAIEHAGNSVDRDDGRTARTPEEDRWLRSFRPGG